MSLEQQRAAAANMYGAGADGIGFYNHFNPLSWAPFYPQQLLQLAEMRDPKALLEGDRHYVFEPGWAGSLGFGPDRGFHWGGQGGSAGPQADSRIDGSVSFPRLREPFPGARCHPSLSRLWGEGPGPSGSQNQRQVHLESDPEKQD